MPTNELGEFIRPESTFRNWISADGSSGFKAESGRYHLYVCLACPWVQRTLIVRKIKGLDDVISVTFLDWVKTEELTGWGFNDKKPDTVNNCRYLKEIYLLADPEFSDTVTVPVLWDKQKKTIVSNESGEIIRMLNTEFNAFCRTEDQRRLNLYPEHLQTSIDDINPWIYCHINDGVYKCGFAKTQWAYDKAVKLLFEHMDRVEAILSRQRYLTGSEVTEADVRLFTTMVRFDTVYHHIFKCNRKRLTDYPSLWAFTRDIYQSLDVGDTVDLQYIKRAYYIAHTHVNPLGIVAIGPEVDFTLTHGREAMAIP